MGGGWRRSSTGKHDQPLKSGFLLYPSWSQWVPPVTAGALETCVLQPLMQMTRPCHGDLSRFWRRERTMCDGGHSCRSTRPRASEVAVLACAWCGRVPRRLQWGPAGTVTLRVDVLRRAGRGLRSCRPRSDGELSASPSPQSPGVGSRSWKSRRGVSSAWAGCHAEPACHGDLRTGHCKPAGANVPMRVRGGLAGAQPACTQPSTTEQRCAVTSGSRGPASRTAHRPVLEGTLPQALLSPPLSPAESVLPPRLASRSSRSVFSVGTASGR